MCCDMRNNATELVNYSKAKVWHAAAAMAGGLSTWTTSALTARYPDAPTASMPLKDSGIWPRLMVENDQQNRTTMD
ncbi:hypothetical protein MGU_06254 [Metarhizium guizhouense ARSEF 977]|uniref:Uncharacterized protein n=1 Tax=Metarhizium guizhouense (strain ARSEF 977) TaxID=1276136 RepID=A0A0B4H416_METGA|nr:hypothetical protein MGU_06254 [Metarhizium guizhouense ARSEF 977]